MAFTIYPEDFMLGEKQIKVITGDYDLQVGLKTRSDNTVELIRYEKLRKNELAKTMAKYLANEELFLTEIYVGAKVYKVPKIGRYSDIKESFLEFLNALEK